METFRTRPPQEISGLKVVRLGDLEKGVLVNCATRKVEQRYQLPRSDVIVLYLEKDAKITLRPSGTEPKIKFYFAMVDAEPGDLDQKKERTDRRINELRDDLLKLAGSIVAPA
jgi:phosphoglucomutase